MLGATRVVFLGSAGRPILVLALLFEQTFSSAGSTYFTVPDDTTYIDFEIWGSGGGGGGRYATGSGRGAAFYGGGGGGGGGYAQHTYTASFSSGDRINMVVGLGGGGGKYINPVTFYPGGTGNITQLTSHANSSGTTIAGITAYATGGQGGLSRTTPYGGTGGIGFGSGITLSGTNGQNAGLNSNGGTGGNGASGGLGGVGALVIPATAAQVGTAPGGGGGGAAYSGTYDDGEDGAVGRIVVRAYGYTLPSEP